MAVWPLSHFKSGPFRLFDLTSISHVIDSPRDLFFSPISDSVSTFSANSLDNTRHSPPALLFESQPPHSSPALEAAYSLWPQSVSPSVASNCLFCVKPDFFVLYYVIEKSNFPNVLLFSFCRSFITKRLYSIYILPNVFTTAFNLEKANMDSMTGMELSGTWSSENWKLQTLFTFSLSAVRADQWDWWELYLGIWG